MNTWFECKVRYAEIHAATGKEIIVSAPYLLDSVSYTEAETRIHEEMQQYISGKFSVKGIKPVNYTDILFYDEGEWWYKAKISSVSIDENSLKEKKVANMVLVVADDLKQAYERINESFKDMTVDYEIEGINKSNIREVFPYNLEEKAEEMDLKSKAYKED